MRHGDSILSLFHAFLTGAAMLDHSHKPCRVPHREPQSSRSNIDNASNLHGIIKDISALLSSASGPKNDLHCVLATTIVMRYIETQTLSPDALVELVVSLRSALNNAPITQTKPPAVQIEYSVTADYIICLEDGHMCKSLQRYLKNKFKLSPQAYRLRWGLPADYPMVAENYSRRRGEVARANQLGLYQRAKKQD